MILRLNKHPQEAVVVIDAMGNSLSYGELVGFSKEITTLMPPRSLLFLLTENTVGGVAWSIGCINSGNVPLVLNAHIEEGLYKNLFEIYQPSYLCIPVALANLNSNRQCNSVEFIVS